jgi:hypothetical protein
MYVVYVMYVATPLIRSLDSFAAFQLKVLPLRALAEAGSTHFLTGRREALLSRVMHF